ncbi:sensor domain-containing diguanylate cyclase [Neptuniibacter sp.]|uniref:sensor domain-containing diguanylate cyclase n=1 Tax=Neptuniibacter sp. TaxID=1962643 RepID=UPI002619D7FE|nr:sensor domain-containing diguanylate cyclase [Neptuniibacter sp.]MCP4595682.1 sensor domain-containing diguanylate cyclase [Neptuniibacter sp.]
MIDADHWILEEKEALAPLEKWQKTVDVMARVFSAPAGFIVQRGPSGYQVVISSEQESNPYDAGVLIEEDTNIFCRKVVEEKASLYVKDAPTDPFWDTNPEVVNDGFRSYLGFPVYWPDGVPFGTICVMDYENTDYGRDYIDLLGELRGLIEADLEILHQYHMISNLAMTDELTGLYNRRGFNTVAAQYIALAKRSNISLGLLYMDMDGLKQINDVNGHAAGDDALKSMAASMLSVVREDDVAARLSGDEFVMLIAVNDKEQLESVVQRITGGLNKQELKVSIGGVMLDDPEKDIDYWLEQADIRMYQKKRA